MVESRRAEPAAVVNEANTVVESSIFFHKAPMMGAWTICACSKTPIRFERSASSPEMSLPPFRVAISSSWYRGEDSGSLERRTFFR